MGKLTKSTFRYRGEINWPQFFKNGREFWLEIVDPDDFVEKKYKDKGNEFEGEWEISHKYDAYHKFVYVVDFKAIDMAKTETKGVFNGKLRVYVSAELEENYDEENMAGSKDIFKKKSIIQKLYKRLTTREREENLEDVGISTVNEYVAFLKELCGAQTRD